MLQTVFRALEKTEKKQSKAHGNHLVFFVSDPSKISDYPKEQKFSAKHGSGFCNCTRQPENAGEAIVHDDYREKYKESDEGGMS